jgi:hypothetical protein
LSKLKLNNKKKRSEKEPLFRCAKISLVTSIKSPLFSNRVIPGLIPNTGDHIQLKNNEFAEKGDMKWIRK